MPANFPITRTHPGHHAIQSYAAAGLASCDQPAVGGNLKVDDFVGQPQWLFTSARFPEPDTIADLCPYDLAVRREAGIVNRIQLVSHLATRFKLLVS